METLLSFLLLDLMLYVWHKASHRFDCLWMFHKVHHNDPYLNVSTAFRIHIAELLIIIALKVVYIITLGVDKTMVLTNEPYWPCSSCFITPTFHFTERNAWRRSLSRPICTAHTIRRNVTSTTITTARSFRYGIAFLHIDRTGTCGNRH